MVLLPGLERFELFGKPALQKFLDSRLPSAPITWIDERPGGKLQLEFWRWLSSESIDDEYRVLALPALELREVQKLAELQELLPDGSCEIVPLPDSPVPSLAIAATSESLPPSPPPLDDGAAAKARTAAWVDRTLSPSGLRFCPYTQSAEISGSGLEGYGVTPAPISYAYCADGSLKALLVSFWSEASKMLDAGEEGTSSIVLSAPQWDDRWHEWYTVVFPLLEASVLAAGLGRELGIVCFHPSYVTPDEEWLVKHRFGHMHAARKLRGYVKQHEPELAESLSDEQLSWAGAYQRRSPNAMINVLWARQLEQAEQKRKSSFLYTRNIQRALSEGVDALESASAEERKR